MAQRQSTTSEGDFRGQIFILDKCAFRERAEVGM